MLLNQPKKHFGYCDTFDGEPERCPKSYSSVIMSSVFLVVPGSGIELGRLRELNSLFMLFMISGGFSPLVILNKYRFSEILNITEMWSVFFHLLFCLQFLSSFV